MPLPTTPALTVDCVVFNGRGELLLVRRAHDPFKGAFALPGGFVEVGEDVEAACRRELKEETGVEAGKDIMFFGVYSDPKRDPRGHTVSNAYLVLVSEAKATPGDDAAEARWLKDFASVPLAFDHDRIVADAVQILMSMRKP